MRKCRKLDSITSLISRLRIILRQQFRKFIRQFRCGSGHHSPGHQIKRSASRINNNSARFTDDQVAGSNIPCMDSILEIDIGRTQCHHCHVQCSRSKRTDSEKSWNNCQLFVACLHNLPQNCIPMSDFQYFLEILQRDFQLFCVSIRTEFRDNQCLCNLSLARHMNLFSIIESTLPTACGEQLLQHWIEYDGDFGHFVHQQRYRYARMRKTVHEVHCAIDWIDYPCWAVAQHGFGAFAGSLFANETATKIGITFGKCRSGWSQMCLFTVHLPMMRKSGREWVNQ